MPSDLDERLQFQGKHDFMDQFMLMQTSDYDSVLLGIIKEIREIEHQYIEQEAKSEGIDPADWGIF